MVGLTLGNRYIIEENVGVGGMAVVYRAKDTLLNRNVAVKVLKNEFMDDDEFLKKFAMEAQSAASLSHQNIVSVYDVGSSTIDEKKYNYIVMEYIDGKTLKDVINEGEELSPEYIANIGFQIASAIEAAHKNGVIHRDIKPHNILINKDNIAKVTDFGIARLSSSATITYTSTVLGTVHYISPEQAKGKFIDEKSDIYSLGVVLYEMATGQVPFDAENAVGIALKHIQDPLLEPKSINEKVPDGLNEIIIKAMQKNPGDRFENATEFKIALLNFRNYKANYNKEDLEKTERIGVITDEDLENRKDNKATYTMKKDEEEYKEKKPKKKKGKKIFKTYILPILLALLVMTVAVVGVKAFKGDLFAKKTIKTPSLIDLTYEKAEEEIKKLNFELTLEKKFENEEAENLDESELVIKEQNPESGSDIKKGTKIEVVLGTSAKMITLDDYRGQRQESAKAKLDALGLKVVIKEENSDDFPVGQVSSQDPGPGEVEEGSTVTLYISQGKEKEKGNMPGVEGSKQSDAITLLKNTFGLKVTTKSIYDDNVEEGRVISQSIKEGTPIVEGQNVTLNISKGKDPSKNTEATEPTEKEKDMINARFSIKVDNIAEGRYKVVVKDKNSGEEIVNEYRNTGDGDTIIETKARSNRLYDIYVNGELYNTVNT